MAAPRHEFIANLLDASAPAYANLAAQRLLARNPDVGRRYGAQAPSQWRSNLTQRVLDLAAAVELQSPALFGESMRWSRDLFTSRDLPADDLRASLNALSEVLLEELPEDAGPEIANTITVGARALDAPAVPPQRLDPQQPHHRLGLDYLDACMQGETTRATDMILAAVRNGMSIAEVCFDVLAPSLAEVGQLWHAGRVGVHEEHTVTAATQRLLGMLAGSATLHPRNGRTVVGATVQGNAHDTAIRMIMMLFEVEGWKAVGLGGELPPEDVAYAVRDVDAHLVVMSAMLVTQLRAMRRTIAAVRSMSPETRILVGGRAFAAAPEVARTIGADAISQDARDVTTLGAQLVGLR